MPARPVLNPIKTDTFLGVFTRKIGVRLLEGASRSRLKFFEKHLYGENILDVGLGTGSMGKILKNKGFRLIGIDVDNTSLYGDIQPVIYDGRDIPFPTNKFDTGMLICVLHHCNDQLKVLEETMRVCKRVIIIEDTFRNNLERFLVGIRDSVGNFEFYYHKYRSTNEWLRVFKIKHWKVISKKEWSSLSFFGMYGRQTLFVIERES